MLIAGEEEDFEADLNARDDSPPPANTQLTLLELSMFALGGIIGPHTMKLHGHIAELEVVVMINSGASHCFINQTTIDRLGLYVTSRNKFRVRLRIPAQCQREFVVLLRFSWVQYKFK